MSLKNPSPAFIPALITWFEQEAADLPWRRTRNPYYIWLAEIMLQQTQVATVMPYYERFIEKFPTIADLARAPQDDLLKYWEGLGYYSRARNLQAAAQQIMQIYDGTMPTTAAELLKLKGIGRYTAGAIASIAFGEPSALVDGNVIRVFARLFDIADDVSQPKTVETLWQIADHLMTHVPAGKAGDYNQALMELGREVCKPRQPRCDVCPIGQYCMARKLSNQHERPVKQKKLPTPHYDVTCGLIRDAGGQLLIAKRRDNALLGGLWEFPGGKVEADETLQACLARELNEELGIEVQVGDFFVQVKHAFTHFKITLHAFACTLAPTSPAPTCHDCAEWRWVTEAELDDYAFGKADRQIIAALRERRTLLL